MHPITIPIVPARILLLFISQFFDTRFNKTNIQKVFALINIEAIKFKRFLIHANFNMDKKPTLLLQECVQTMKSFFREIYY